MTKEDIHNHLRALENAEKYISKLLPEDREDVKRFIEDAWTQGYSAGWVLKYLSTLSVIRKTLNKPYKEAKESDLKGYVAWLEKSDYAENTKYDFKTVLRIYLRWLGRGDVISWLKIRTPKNGMLPDEVLTEDDIKTIADAAYTTRDKAFILSLYESGCLLMLIDSGKQKSMSFREKRNIERFLEMDGYYERVCG